MNKLTYENYDFKKIMQDNINQDIQTLLYANNFNKYKVNSYVRERDKLLNIISFRVEKDRVKAFAMYIPIFFPYDNILEFGIEIAGWSGTNLLGGKYFTTIYEKEKNDKIIQFEHYNSQHIINFNKLVLSIKEGIIPEMDKICSLRDFIIKIESNKAEFFGHRFRNEFKNNEVYQYITSVYQCLNDSFEHEIDNLINLKKSEQWELIKVYIERLLKPKEVNMQLRQEDFLENFEEICNERRRKYKLLHRS